jgi:hypothetical protein
MYNITAVNVRQLHLHFTDFIPTSPQPMKLAPMFNKEGV